jgi:hypothetical protein
MKILQNVLDFTKFLNYLFVCFIIPAFCDLEWIYMIWQHSIEMRMIQSRDQPQIGSHFLIVSCVLGEY